MEQNKNWSEDPIGLWTEPTVRRMVGLWRERMSAARIASILGPAFSRSAVVGRLFRMGLCRTDEQRRDAQSAGARRTRRLRPPALPAVPLPPPTPCAVVPRMVGILELSPRSCRWPYSVEGVPRFCGHSVAPEGVYCLGHRAIAYAGTLPPLTLEMLEAPGPARNHR